MAGSIILQGTVHPPSCPLEKYLSDATIHVDPATESGTGHHHRSTAMKGGLSNRTDFQKNDRKKWDFRLRSPTGLRRT